MNRHHQRRRILGAGSIAHGVGEGVGEGVATRAQRLNRGIALVDDVGVGPVRRQRQGAVASGQSIANGTRRTRSAFRAGAYGTDGLALAAAIDVGVVGQHIARTDAAGRAVADAAGLGGAGRVIDADRRVVRTLDGDGERARTAGRGRIGHGVAEAFRYGLARGAQGLHRAVAVIDDVAIRAVGVERQGAVGTCPRTSADGDGLGLAIATGVYIGVVAEYVARGCAACGGVGRAAFLRGGTRVGNRYRRVVEPLYGDGQRGRTGGAGGVAHGVGEGVGEGLGVDAQCFDRRLAVVERVDIGAVAEQFQRSVASGRAATHRACGGGADRGYGARVTAVDIGVIAQDVAVGHRRHRAIVHAARFDGGLRVVDGCRCVVGARDGDHHVLRCHAGLAVVDAHRVSSADGLAGLEEIEGRIRRAETPRLRPAAAVGAVDLGAQREGVGERRLLTGCQRPTRPDVAGGRDRNIVSILQIDIGESDRAACRVEAC